MLNQFNPTTIDELGDFFEKSKRMPYLTIVIRIPSGLWPKLSFIQQQLQAVDSDHLYYPPQLCHITIKELGWLDETITISTLRWIYKQMKDICLTFKPFTAKIKGLSYFSNTVFCEIQSQDPIRQLHFEIINRLKQRVTSGEFEGDKFVAHISLLYFISKNVERLLHKIKQLSHVDIGKMMVKSIDIAYGYPHLLLDPSEEKRSKALSYIRKFRLKGGNKVQKAR
jgi:2'-5' RNA ligase